MPAGYSVLDNRPLDHWKVTELKDELRRRKMTTKGLKEDLIKRLDEAIRNERATVNDQEVSKQQEIIVTHQSEGVGTEKDSFEAVVEFGGNKSEHHPIMVDINAPINDPDLENEVHQEESATTVDLDDGPEEKTTNIAGGKELNDTAVLENKVSEVSPGLGLQVMRSAPIYNDSVPLGEQIEPKNDSSVNNFDLEETVKSELTPSSNFDLEEPVKSELIQPSPKPLDINESFVEEDDNKKIDGSLGGSPEKLNLDRSSSDESMEEDVLDTKHVESNDNSVEVGDKEVRDLHVIKEEALAVSDDKIHVSASTEKRKPEDLGPSGSTEPIKRQRRWAAESIKIPDKAAQHPPNESLVVTSSDTAAAASAAAAPPLTPHGAASAASTESHSPKERVVPPSQKTPTTSLRIDRFLRPFTLKAVQELLAKTGTVSSFWMDHIKTHCYVTYSSVEEAVTTRNGVYNLQWPPNGGRLLVADFVDPEEVKARIEAPPESPVPTTPVAVVPNRQVPVNALPTLKEKVAVPLPPPQPPAPAKVVEPPILTLDDLFKKTKATPRIYYLPLTEEQVAAKGKGVDR